ncbi:hypothetical protein CDD82_6682 [Ophiocordyceps australis]|uniref:Cytochrome P450 monooxygenase n=1 Tax=Ophiocordyceps australis TaxID=1399860 RepID=A0A2C5YVY4_9HYPO|nr:hypothetical protein CDD82_6682 [Ophiocordyceps australis]
MLDSQKLAFVLVLIGIGIVILAWVVQHLYPKPYPGIPYNKASANRISGDIPDIAAAVKKANQLSEGLLDVSTRKLGSPIAQVLFTGFQKPFIVLDDAREVEDICVRRNAEFDIAPMVKDIGGAVFPNSSITMDKSPELRAFKRRWGGAVGSEFVRQVMAAHAYRGILDLVDLWRLRVSANNGEPFEVTQDLENCFLEVIWKSALAQESGVMAWEMAKLQQKTNPANPPRGVLIRQEVKYRTELIRRNSLKPSPAWAQRLATHTPRFRRSKLIVNQELGPPLEEAIARFQKVKLDQIQAESLDSDTCMLDLVIRRQMLEAYKSKGELPHLSKSQKLIDEIFSFILGGFDSTSTVVAWFALFMQAYPKVQTHLRKKLHEAFPRPKMPSVREILDTDVPYLSCVCEETVRFAGAAKGQGRQATVDTEILGCKIPKGAQIFMNLYIDREPYPVDERKRSSSSQVAGARRGESAEKKYDLSVFEPKRWLVRHKTTGQESFNSQALPCTAFGGGLRGCPGRKLADMELRISLVLLILNFEFLALPEELGRMSAHERFFRRPDFPFVKLCAL